MEEKQKIDIFENSGTKYEGKSYLDDYEKFMETFRHGEVSGAEVGEVIARMAQYFSRYNLMTVRSLKIYNQISRDIYNQPEGTSGKSISAAKAGVLADATPEAAAYQEARAHTQNIEQMINSLKSLQKGILLEYAHSV